MIELARLVDRRRPRASASVSRTRSRSRSGRRTPQIAKAKFAMDGDKTYPDATFTLRLAFGTVKGYEEDGKTVPPFTTIGGPVRAGRRSRATRPPFELPQRWVETQGQARPEDAVQLRLHGRHHRRQLGQPGGQPRTARWSA